MPNSSLINSFVDASYLSGFLESGHTRNSNKAWSKARGGFSVLSLLSVDGRELDACRHLRATADGGARVPRSADASRPHTLLSMVWQLATGPLRADRKSVV